MKIFILALALGLASYSAAFAEPQIFTAVKDEKGFAAQVVQVKTNDDGSIELDPFDQEAANAGATVEKDTVALSWGFELNSNQGVAASLGVLIGDIRCYDEGRRLIFFGGPYQCKDTPLFLVQITPGLFGGKLSLGVAKIFHSERKGRKFFTVPLTAYALKATVFHAWLNTEDTSEEKETRAAEFSDLLVAMKGETYVGLEGTASLWFLRATVGVLREVAGPSSSPDWDRNWLLSFGLGTGF